MATRLPPLRVAVDHRHTLIICRLLGVPAERYGQFREWTEMFLTTSQGYA